MSQQAPMSYILPEDGVVLRQATREACARASAKTVVERDRIADAVLWLARCSYGRRADGTLDAEVLVQAALAQFWDRRFSLAEQALRA